MGYLIFEKYAPMLRLVDSLVSVKDVSPLHNSALFVLIDSIFQNLYVLTEYAEEKEKLPTNFKKLIENYLDLLGKTQHKPSPQTISYLSQWKDHASLKGLVKQVIG
jgi:hypothetical protein